jgi:hypothetical protein
MPAQNGLMEKSIMRLLLCGLVGLMLLGACASPAAPASRCASEHNICAAPPFRKDSRLLWAVVGLTDIGHPIFKALRSTRMAAWPAPVPELTFGSMLNDGRVGRVSLGTNGVLSLTITPFVYTLAAPSRAAQHLASSCDLARTIWQAVSDRSAP